MTQPANLPAPTVPCDLCEWPMALPEHCVERGEILGLLVCTLCVEDQLQSETVQ